MILHIELEQEADSRWIAEVTELPGVLAYGVTRPDAVAKLQALPFECLPSGSSVEKQSPNSSTSPSRLRELLGGCQGEASPGRTA